MVQNHVFWTNAGAQIESQVRSTRDNKRSELVQSDDLKLIDGNQIESFTVFCSFGYSPDSMSLDARVQERT